MATMQEALSAWFALLGLFQKFNRSRFALLGDGNGNVNISDRPLDRDWETRSI